MTLPTLPARRRRYDQAWLETQEFARGTLIATCVAMAFWGLTTMMLVQSG